MELKKPLKKYNPSLNLIRDEEGSSMVEFALVLPLLIVLTVGSIYLSIGFTQKSLMNGLAFMETRAASVRQQHNYIAEHAVRNYVKSTEGNQKWIEQAKSEIKVDKVTNDLTVIVSKDALNTEILSNTLNVIGGNKPDGKAEIKKLKTAMVLPIEYITLAGRSDRPITSTTIKYGAESIGFDFLNKNLLDKLPQSVSDMILKMFPKSLIDEKSDHLADGTHETRILDGILSADYTKNMVRVNKAYDYWGLKHESNHLSEIPENFNITDVLKDIDAVNKLGFMKVTADNISMIENGADLAQIALKFSTFGPAIQGALKPIKSVGGAVLPVVENVGTEFANLAEKNNNLMFKKSIVGPE